MAIIYRKRTSLKLTVILFFGVLVIAVLFLNDRQKAIASASGPSPSYTNAPEEDNCTACHNSFPVNSGSGNVQIAGVPQTYVPGQQVAITVTTSQSDAVIYGFQLTAINQEGKAVGTFTLPTQTPRQTQLVNGFVNSQNRRYVEHTLAGTAPTQFGSKSWTFTWRAPNPVDGQIDFYAAGNSANSDAGTSGDYIYTSSTSSSPAAAFSISGRVFLSDGSHGLRNAAIVLTDQNGVSQSATTSTFGFYSFSNVFAGQTYTLAVKSKLFKYASMILTVTGDLANVDFIGLE